MIFVVAIYFMMMPASSWASYYFAVKKNMSEPEIWAVVGGILFPLVGTILSLVLIIEELQNE